MSTYFRGSHEDGSFLRKVATVTVALVAIAIIIAILIPTLWPLAGAGIIPIIGKIMAPIIGLLLFGAIAYGGYRLIRIPFHSIYTFFAGKFGKKNEDNQNSSPPPTEPQNDELPLVDSSNSKNFFSKDYSSGE